MSIIHRNDNSFDDIGMAPAKDDVCFHCGDNIFRRRPLMVWRGPKNVFLCGDCGVKIEESFNADLIELSAAQRLQKIFPTYKLTRSMVKS